MTTKQPLNQILYGPPGTGKTYNTIYKALDILEPLKDGKSWSDLEGPDTNWDKDEYGGLSAREYALNCFNAFKKHGQIVMTTFHQSMSYEDFIEGIKPITIDKEGKILDRMVYEIVDGIMKEYVASINRDRNVDTEFVSFLFDSFIQRHKNEPSVTISNFDIKVRDNGRSLVILSSTDNDQGSITKDHIIDITNGRASDSNADRLRKKNEFYNYLLENSNNYVLIVDEINRGNVANIFGELITLIEDDKRTTKLDEKKYVNNPEGVKVKLPYSGDEFGVPGNLYIIGTMNTADRSVEALDSALRRRFSFTEMMPKPELLKDVKINEVHISNGTAQASLADLLYTINKRIEILKDREHQIGHSYFMKFVNDKKYENGVDAEELREVFYNKIIPLLQEYFYGDYESILKVLSSDFIIKEETKDDNNKTVDFFGNISNEVGIDKPMDLPYTINIIENGKFTDAINSLKLVKWTE